MRPEKGSLHSKFNLLLSPLTDEDPYKYLPTYHGATVYIVYFLSIRLKRPFLLPDLKERIEVFVSCQVLSPAIPSTPNTKPQMKSHTLQSQHTEIELMLLDACSLDVNKIGELQIIKSEKTIKEIELFLLCVETWKLTERKGSLFSLQIVDGNATPMLKIPIYFNFPRFFSIPSISSSTLKIQFMFKVSVQLVDQSKLEKEVPVSIFLPNAS
eukprot:TRINITY_DN7075_c0_g1_i1.p1 TRINITY_DN7075_c0_g1~~TRINITY_DN7075_c0_g1_i1.p1  ORF type:complete len:212 (+),score=38.94 TRINITY_DN7075_c0_g1_i1:257-892(+)